MNIRIALAAALIVAICGCMQIRHALGGAEPAAAQRQENPANPDLAGLDVVAGGYVRVVSDTWGCDYKCFNFPGRWF